MTFTSSPSGTAEHLRPHPEETEWPEKIRAGSLPAFEALFHAYYQPMVSFARCHVERLDVAEELVQDVFLNIWKDRRNWNPKGTLRTYLLGAARKHSLTYLRRRKIERRWEVLPVEGPPSFTPEDALAYDELSAAVRAAIDALPERRRIVFSLSRQQGLSYAEIAALLEISPKTVEHQVCHALKFLRQRLGSLLPFFATTILYACELLF